jgi:hypothetical protein
MTGRPAEVVALAFALNAATLTILVAAFRSLGQPPGSTHRRSLWIVTVTIGIVLSLGNLPQRFVPDPGTLAATVAMLIVLLWAFVLSVRLDAAAESASVHVPAFHWGRYAAYLVYFGSALALAYAGALVVLPITYALLLVLTSGAAVVSSIYLLRLIRKMIFGPGNARPQAQSRPRV